MSKKQQQDLFLPLREQRSIRLAHIRSLPDRSSWLTTTTGENWSVRKLRGVRDLLEAMLEKFSDGETSFAHPDTIASYLNRTGRTVGTYLRQARLLTVLSIPARRKTRGRSRMTYQFEWSNLRDIAFEVLPEEFSRRLGLPERTGPLPERTGPLPERTGPLPEKLSEVNQPVVNPYKKTSPSSFISSETWEGVRDFLLECGVVKVRDALRHAKENGLTPAHCVALIEHFRSQRHTHGWRAGALYVRVVNGFPTQPITDGWVATEGNPATPKTFDRRQFLEAKRFALTKELRKRGATQEQIEAEWERRGLTDTAIAEAADGETVE